MKLDTTVRKGITASKSGAPVSATQPINKGKLSEESAAKIRAKASRLMGSK